MEEHRIPNRLFYSQLTQSSLSCGEQFKRYKDTLKANLKSCGIPFDELESRASDRPVWHTTCRVALVAFEYNRINQLKEKQQRRKLQPTATADCFMCNICRRRVVQESPCSQTEEFITDEIRCIDDSVYICTALREEKSCWQIALSTALLACIDCFPPSCSQNLPSFVLVTCYAYYCRDCESQDSAF